VKFIIFNEDRESTGQGVICPWALDQWLSFGVDMKFTVFLRYVQYHGVENDETGKFALNNR